MGTSDETPQGYDLTPPEGWKPQTRDPAIQAMMDGESKVSLKDSAIELVKTEYLNRYYKIGGGLKMPGSPYPTRSSIMDGESKIDLKPDPHVLVSYWALLTPMRQYVIDKIKAPLQKAIEGAKRLSNISQALFSALKKIPLITKENTCFINTHILIDKKELFLKYHYNPNRGKLCEAAFNLDIFEYEHDGYYAFLQDWLLIELALEIAKGNWKPRFTKFPMKGEDINGKTWSGPDLLTVEEIRQKMREALNEPIPERSIIFHDLLRR